MSTDWERLQASGSPAPCLPSLTSSPIPSSSVSEPRTAQEVSERFWKSQDLLLLNSITECFIRPFSILSATFLPLQWGSFLWQYTGSQVGDLPLRPPLPPLPSCSGFQFCAFFLKSTGGFCFSLCVQQIRAVIPQRWELRKTESRFVYLSGKQSFHLYIFYNIWGRIQDLGVLVDLQQEEYSLFRLFLIENHCCMS